MKRCFDEAGAGFFAQEISPPVQIDQLGNDQRIANMVELVEPLCTVAAGRDDQVRSLGMQLFEMCLVGQTDPCWARLVRQHVCDDAFN